MKVRLYEHCGRPTAVIMLTTHTLRHPDALASSMLVLTSILIVGVRPAGVVTPIASRAKQAPENVLFGEPSNVTLAAFNPMAIGPAPLVTITAAVSVTSGTMADTVVIGSTTTPVGPKDRSAATLPAEVNGSLALAAFMARRLLLAAMSILLLDLLNLAVRRRALGQGTRH